SLYTYGSRNYPPQFDTGPAPECRVAISPLSYTTEDLFLNVLTATDSSVASVESATTATSGDSVRVKVGRWSVTFTKSQVGFAIESEGCSLPGDADGDGSVGLADVIEIIRFAAKLKTPSSQQTVCADINGDGRINVLDVVSCLVLFARSGG
ncbi:MAG TPA: dockerin type I repeat-containing protein, partial [Candidatus Glassbacteria bacterium]|nr:dockerin type I repeat-containing protein [Candidatus Glassbacteria bacterium]